MTNISSLLGSFGPVFGAKSGYMIFMRSCGVVG